MFQGVQWLRLDQTFANSPGGLLYLQPLLRHEPERRQRQRWSQLTVDVPPRGRYQCGTFHP
jgi:hypothetical protein